MNYNELIDLLTSDNIYDLLNRKEREILKLIPELKLCVGFNQNSKWHIYDVYEHILHVVSGVSDNKCLRIAALFHDIGKPLTYTEDNNKVGHFYGHWDASVLIFKKYQDLFCLTDEEKKLIINLIFYHDIDVEKLSKIDLENLVKAFGSNIKLLFDLKKADLLAQSQEYHYLINKIKADELRLIRIKENTK